MKYIKNDKQYGIEYNWREIRKEFKKLKIPPDVYNPCNCPLEHAKYFVANSEREVGKTTNWLLLGMVMNRMYKTIIHYVRQTENMIMPKSLRDLFSVIQNYQYIQKITDGKYNSVYYHSRRFYYCQVDDAGNIIETAPEHFMFCCCVEKAMDLKSGYNAPTGDLIIFDEFIGKYYYQNEFVYFEDLCKTIIRGRHSPIIVMLANTINPHSTYYNELEIYDTVAHMQAGDKEIVTTHKGTKIYVERVGVVPEKREKRDIVNRLFFGFKNPLLASITGEDWAISSYQHIPADRDDVDPEVITRRIYIYHNSKYVRLDVMQHPELGLCLYVHWATRTYSDSYILTTEFRTDNRYHYRLGSGNVEKLLKMCIRENRVYYQTNDLGSFVENYVVNVCGVKI